MPVWIALSLLIGCAKREPQPAAAAEVSAPAPREAAVVERPLLLWELERDGARAHLLGTCHFGVPLEEALPEPHLERLSASRILLVEMDLELDLSGALHALWNPDGPDLRERLGEEAWRGLAYRVRDLMPASALNWLRPWGGYSLQLAAQWGASVPSLDRAVAEHAQAHGVGLGYLETMEEQVAVLSSLDDDFVEGLQASPDDVTQRAWLEAVLELCREGRVEPVEALLADPTADLEPMLSARNHAWMPRLQEELAQGDAFVAVGAAHLLGPDGLLTLLGAQGWTARRLVGVVPADVSGPSLEELLPEPAPELDEENVASWSAVFQAQLPGMLCAPGNPVPDCLTPDVNTCQASVARDVGLCVEQIADLLPPFGAAFDPALAERLGECAVAGLIMNGMVQGMPDLPHCNEMREAVQAVAP